MTSLWSRFRSLPVWVQALGWLLLWPALLAMWLLQRENAGVGSWLAAAVLAVVAVGWIAAPFAEETEPADGQRAAVEASVDADADGEATGGATDDPASQDLGPAASESPSPSSPPSRSPSPVPSPSPSPTPSPSLTPSPAPPPADQVVRVIDGDTLEATGSDGSTYTVRLAQVDAPETDQCYGDEATAALRQLAGPGTEFELHRPGPPFEDPYGRTLGEVVLLDGTSVSVELVRHGYAEWGESFADEDAQLAARMREAEEAARGQGDGLWTACESPPPPPPEPSEEAAGEQEAEEPPAEDGGTPFGGSSCHPAYDPCVPPKSEVGDLNCPDIRREYPNGVSVDQAHGDPHGLDGDSDGHGCE